MASKKRIFVSMASYRDPELIPTINHCLANAENPQNVRIGVAWQHCENEPRPERADLIDIDYRDSKGACWARSKIQTDLYDGEEYFLQLDSHHRFAPAWDRVLLEMMDRCESDNPVLSSYVPNYKPEEFKPTDMRKMKFWGMTTSRFQTEKESYIPLLKPHDVPQNVDKPLPGKFVAAGLLFAKGDFVRKVPYDPNLYFIGEEITLAVRAYTHGYDLFVPDRVVVAHEYGRTKKPKHWKDHKKKESKGTSWNSYDVMSKMRSKLLLTGDLEDVNRSLGNHGLGRVRTMDQYEKYSGLLFKKKYVNPNSEKHGYAVDLGEWGYETPKKKMYHVSCEIEKEEVFQGPDISFCRLAVLDGIKGVIDSENLEGNGLSKYKGKDRSKYTSFVHSVEEPKYLAVWPYSKEVGWLNRLEKALTINDL